MKLLRRLDYWVHQRQREADLAEEIEFHRAQSARPIGNATLAREDARAVWVCPWLESVIQDLRYAVRNVRRQPGFAAVVILTLSVAMGLNTSFFSVFDAVMLRPWPVKDPAQVVQVLGQERKSGPPHGFSLAEYRFFVEHAKSLRSIVAMGGRPVRLGFEDFGKRSWAIAVSGNYFQALGVAMQLGRGFVPEEDDVDSPENVAVLSFPLWRDHFGSDPAISGKKIHLDEVPFTIVGVAAEEFTGTLGGREDLWIPAAALQSLRLQGNTHAFVREPQACCSSIAGRIAPGSSRDQVQAEISVLTAQFHAEHRLDPVAIRLADPTILAAHPKRRNFVPVFSLLFASLTLVLLLACANVSNLLLARAVARHREISVRRALGAGRARVIRQLLTEGFVFAAASSAFGVALAWKLPDYVFAVAGDGPNVRLIPDTTVIFYAAALVVITCFAFALAPALHGTHANPDHTRLPLRNILLGAQFAICVVLLIGAGLLVSGLQHAHEQNPGFHIHDVSVVSFEVPVGSYDSKRTVQFFNELSKELDSQPQLAPAAITAREPLSHSHWNSTFRLPGETPDTEHNADFQQVSPAYFDVLGIPLVAGRNFLPGDEERNIVLINESLARRYFDGSNPVGKSIVQRTTASEIVGVVRDANLAYVDGPSPMLFTPIAGDQIPKVLVRSSAAAQQALDAMAKRIEPRARVKVTPLSDNLDEQLSGSRTMAAIAGALGVFALALASIGISGVFAYIVEQQRKEIGIRMALGAAPTHVIGLVLSGPARAVLWGLVIGYVAAAGFARLMAQYLYGVSPYDPRSYATVAAVLMVAGLAAAYLPARRATSVDPLTALRLE